MARTFDDILRANDLRVASVWMQQRTVRGLERELWPLIVANARQRVDATA